MEDQSRCGAVVYEHFKKKFRCDDAECPVLWRLRVRSAIRRGHSLGVLSYAEFCGAFELVKRNVATCRDNNPGSVFRLLPENVRNLLHCAVVERLAGREDGHVRNWE